MARKMLSVTSCDYMDSGRYAYLDTSGGHKLFNVNKPHHIFHSKLSKGTLALYWNISDITKTSVSSEQIVTALYLYWPAWAEWNGCPSASSYWQWGVDTQCYSCKLLSSVCSSQWHVGFSPDACFLNLLSPIYLFGRHETALVELFPLLQNPWSGNIDGKALYPKGFIQCCDSTSCSAFLCISK